MGPIHFVEDWENHGCSDFPWDEVFVNLGEAAEVPTEHRRVAQAEFLRRIFTHLMDVNLHTPGADTRVGRRLLALAFVMSPEVFGEQAGWKVARTLHLDEKLFKVEVACARVTLGMT